MIETTRKAIIIGYRSAHADWCRRMVVVATAAVIVLFPLPLIGWLFFSVEQSVIWSLLTSASALSVVFFVIAWYIYWMNHTGTLAVSESGIKDVSGPFQHGPSIPWSKVDKIRVRREAGGEYICIERGSDCPIKIAVDSLTPENVDRLVCACSLWSNRWTQDESFIDLVETVTRQRSNSDGSFTALWLQEANRRLGATPFVPLEPGKLLQDGRVKVVQPLTAGGWSAIYLCQWRGRTSAVLKEAVVPQTADEVLKEKAFEHFEREAVILSSLSHPQIARVLDYFVENARQYMVLERIAGPNLRAYVKDRGAVSEKQALKWAIELAEIVDFLHRREPPIVHRDLTPENLVLDMKGSLVLIDFGSANEFVGTVTGTLVGKPSYISPEQFAGQSTLQSDLYSLGAVMYFLVTGNAPEPMSVASPRQSGALVSEELDRLVSRLMQLDVRERLQTIGELREMLQKIESARVGTSI